MDISIIIVTFNSSGCVNACLESITRQVGASHEILVVDNASKDDTRDKVRNWPCRLIASAENLGFGRGCNLGFSQSQGRYAFFLNPDAYLDGPNTLAQMIKRMDANPSIGLAGTSVLAPDGQPESPPALDYPGQRHLRHPLPPLPGQIAWVIGASMIVRRSLFAELRGFDPSFFLYCEETELCLRIRKAGFQIGFFPEIIVKHIGGASETPGDPYQTAFRKMQGLLRFREKHYVPADRKRLAKRDFYRARWRAAWNGFLIRKGKSSDSAWQKARSYSAIRDVSLSYLKEGLPPS